MLLFNYTAFPALDFVYYNVAYNLWVQLYECESNIFGSHPK